MKVLCFVSLLAISTAAAAGGDYVSGKIVNFSGDSGHYSFRFLQTDARSELLPSCREFDVKVEYERVPWASWLPFIHSVHPTKEETREAASFLRTASRESRDVYFGYMGYGLVPSGTACAFSSRGLSLDQEHDMNVVLSFYNQI